MAEPDYENDNTHYEEAERLLKRSTMITATDLQTHILGHALLAVVDAAEVSANAMQRLASLLECPHGRSTLNCYMCRTIEGAENPA